MTNNHIQSRISKIFKTVYDFEIDPHVLQMLTEEIFVYHHELELQNHELKRIQRSLDEKRVFFQQVFHEAPVGYVIVDDGGAIHHINERAKNQINTQSDDFKEKKIQNYISSEGQDDFYLAMKQFLKGTDKSFVFPFKTLEGNKKFIVSASTFKENNENFVHLTLTNIP